MIDAILTNTMLPEMSIALLERQMSGEEVAGIEVGVDGTGFTYNFIAKGVASPEKVEAALAAVAEATADEEPLVQEIVDAPETAPDGPPEGGEETVAETPPNPETPA